MNVPTAAAKPCSHNTIPSPPAPILDGLTPQEPQQELAALVCDLCGECWYALPGETSESACRRICKEEEPRP